MRGRVTSSRCKRVFFLREGVLIGAVKIRYQAVRCRQHQFHERKLKTPCRANVLRRIGKMAPIATEWRTTDVIAAKINKRNDVMHKLCKHIAHT